MTLWKYQGQHTLHGEKLRLKIYPTVMERKGLVRLIRYLSARVSGRNLFYLCDIFIPLYYSYVHELISNLSFSLLFLTTPAIGRRMIAEMIIKIFSSWHNGLGDCPQLIICCTTLLFCFDSILRERGRERYVKVVL